MDKPTQLAKPQLLQILSNVYLNNGIEEVDQINIDVFTKDEAIENGIDEDVSVFSDEEYQFVLMYNDNPDYHFVYGHQTIEEVEETFLEWLKEINVTR